MDLFIGRNATHLDLHYKPEFVDPIVARVAGLFRRHL
jgi:hypothetical protein